MSAAANTAENTTRPGLRPPFKKGESGNPSGRPKKTPAELDLIALCRAKCPEALEVMLHIMHNGDNDRAKLAAAQLIIERAYGKPIQPTDVALTGALLIGEVKWTVVKPSS